MYLIATHVHNVRYIKTFIDEPYKHTMLAQGLQHFSNWLFCENWFRIMVVRGLYPSSAPNNRNLFWIYKWLKCFVSRNDKIAIYRQYAPMAVRLMSLKPCHAICDLYFLARILNGRSRSSFWIIHKFRLFFTFRLYPCLHPRTQQLKF